MEEVDSAVSDVVGCSVHDLPDFPSRAMFDAGDSPDAAVKVALANAGFPI